MSPDAWITLGVVALVIGLLALTRISPDLIVLGGLTLLLVSGVLDANEALAGLANPGVITVAVLFVVVASLRRTGAISWGAQKLLRRPKSLLDAQRRIMLPTAAMSAFLNNTPVVAMFIPAVSEWARKHDVAVSKLLIPLSYAAILGGMCTLVGTSTNLVVNGLLMSEAKARMPEGMDMFDLAWVGVPCAVVGIVYLLLFSRRLLPDREPAISPTDDLRQYTVEMLVEPGGPLAGQTIGQAGLRHLPGMYLMEIERDGEAIVAVGPQERLRGGDRLIFAGVVESVADLQKIRGLTPATDQVFKLDSPRSSRCLIEAVVSGSCRLIGQSIREGGFRSVYSAAVIAVARSGQRIRKKVGDIVLQAGDVLLLEAHPSFVARQRNSRDFFLVSAVQDSTPPRYDKAPLAVVILAAMVLAVSVGWLSMLEAAMLAGGIMIITRCLPASDARRSVDWQLLVIIAAALGIGKAIDKTGLAAGLADVLIGAGGQNPWVALAIVAAIASLLNGFITSNAAAVLVFPIAVTAADRLGVNVMPFAIAIMIASAGSFATPLGYQTNLMVYGPGGYRFADYLRTGLPLNILIWATAVILSPLVWPFS